MKNIAVIFGGKSPEYDVSLQSAYSIIKAIDSSKYQVILVGITRVGEWYHYDGRIDAIKDDKWHKSTHISPASLSLNPQEKSLILYEVNNIKSIHLDAVFPVLHGQNGEDGKLQGLLELIEIPIVGCGLLASTLCMDKYLAHELVRGIGIKCPLGHVFNKNGSNEISKYCNKIGFPCFIKPLRAGSSFGISKINNINQLEEAVSKAFEYDSELIVEEYIDGFEVGCAILGTSSYIVGEIDEIELSEGFFNYEEKYNLKTSKIHVPARIDQALSDKCKDISLMIYKRLACKGFARVDCFIDRNNQIIFNEVNTIPGFTDHSRFPNMLKMKGWDLKMIINYAIAEVFDYEY